MKKGVTTFNILGFIEFGVFAFQDGKKVDGWGICFFDRYCYTNQFGWEKI